MTTAKALVTAIALPFFFIGERLWPASVEARRTAAAMPRLGRNLGLAALNGWMSPLWTLPLTTWASQHAWPWRPESWHGPLAVLIDLVLLDLWIYAWHRANHRLPLLWRFHAIHHLDETLDTTSAVRFHFGEVMLSALARAAVIVAFDVPLASVLLFESLVLITSAFHHSNLRLPAAVERAASRIVVTPSLHWVHHHAVRADTDSNYATILSIWDPLFGTRSATRRAVDLPIGVEGARDQRFVRLLVDPFRLAD